MKAQKDPVRYEKAADILKALAHPVRLCMAHNILENGGCSVGHMQEYLGISQSLTSQHLAKLKAAGILRAERKGKNMEYCIADEAAASVVRALLDKE